MHHCITAPSLPLAFRSVLGTVRWAATWFGDSKCLVDTIPTLARLSNHRFITRWESDIRSWSPLVYSIWSTSVTLPPARLPAYLLHWDVVKAGSTACMPTRHVNVGPLPRDPFIHLIFFISSIILCEWVRGYLTIFIFCLFPAILCYDLDEMKWGIWEWYNKYWTKRFLSWSCVPS